ncbi:MAG: phage exclusion protein Lit family protein [Gammaproteobacteria bacterium]|nr:hypothetical protein [Magnetovibrio sp.]
MAPSFQLVDDNHPDGRFIMDAGAFRYIVFNHRALRAFWFSGYIAWEGYRLVAENPVVELDHLDQFQKMLASFDAVITSDNPDLEPLPFGVAEPGNYADRNSNPQSRAAGEIATISTAWALLHEVQHIKHQQSGTGANQSDPTQQRLEEFSCDKFATEFLLEGAETYAKSQKVDVALVNQKRRLGIYFALFALTVLAKHKWEESETHPAVQDRIDAVCSIMSSNKSEIADAMAHTSFAVLRTLWPNAPGVFL